MAVFRIEKNRNYTTMSNFHLQDPSLSLKAKGLLSMLLSLPDSWNYSVRGLSAISREGVDGIVSGLKELEGHGYLVRSQLRLPNGRMGQTEYTIYELPRETPCTEKPDTAGPDTNASYPKKPAQINNQVINTERKKDEKKEARHAYGAYQNVLFTEGELSKLKSEFPGDYEQRIERLSEYMASTGKSYKNHLATLRVWARRECQNPTPTDAYRSHYTYEEGESL